MNRISDAVQHFSKGYACSQAVLSVYAESFGLDKSLALKLSAGFAAGMRRGETCGAVTGAFMVLGLAFSPGDCSTKEGRNRVYAAVSTFSEQFKARNNTLGCKELLGCDINTEDGLKHAFENKLFQTRCAKFVQDTVEILEEMTGSKKPSFGSGAQA